VNGETTYLLRVDNVIGTRTWSEWLRSTPTGKVTRTTDPAKATRFTATDANAAEQTYRTGTDAIIARTNKSGTTHTYTIAREG
jgi:hypothetical protein